MLFLFGTLILFKDNVEIGKRFVESLIQWLDSHDAHKSEGLFRRSGSEVRLQALMNHTNELAHKFYTYKFYGIVLSFLLLAFNF